MNAEKSNSGYAFIIITLLASLDAGPVILKYFTDTEIIRMYHITIAAQFYLVSIAVYALIVAPVLALCYLASRGASRSFRLLASSFAVLFGFIIIYHKHNHVLRYFISSRYIIVVYALIFTFIVYAIWRTQKNRFVSRTFTGVIIASLVLAVIPSKTSGTRDNAENTGPNVILLIVDAMRFDRLGCYGCEKGLTPAMDEIAENSQVYDNTYVHWPTSGPSHSSMLTGLPVYDHNALNGNQLGRKYLTMAEILKEEGYATGGFVQNKLLNYKNNYNQGFDVFITDGLTKFDNANRRVLVDFLLPVVVYNHVLGRDRFTDEAIDWMEENNGRKFFLFLQYFHPHIPYTPPSKFIENKDYHGVINGSLAQSRAIRNGELKVTQEDINYMVGLYEGEIRFADEQIRIIREYLKKAGLFDDTVLLITADHGENLFEHNRYFAHGNELYESTVHIPLIVSYPHGGRKPRRIKEMIRDVDYLSLVLELCGIKHGAQSKRPVLTVNPDLAILGITCNSEQVLLYTKFDNLKYIVNAKTMEDELYDLSVDRHELHNLCPENPEQCGEYRNIVMQEVKDNSMIGDYIANSCIDEKHDRETEDLLRSLGYIQ